MDPPFDLWEGLSAANDCIELILIISNLSFLIFSLFLRLCFFLFLLLKHHQYDGQMQLPGQMQFMQPMMRPTMTIAGPHLLGNNLLRGPGGIPGMPAGKLKEINQMNYLYCFA